MGWLIWNILVFDIHLYWISPVFGTRSFNLDNGTGPTWNVGWVAWNLHGCSFYPVEVRDFKNDGWWWGYLAARLVLTLPLLALRALLPLSSCLAAAASASACAWNSATRSKNWTKRRWERKKERKRDTLITIVDWNWKKTYLWNRNEKEIDRGKMHWTIKMLWSSGQVSQLWTKRYGVWI